MTLDSRPNFDLKEEIRAYWSARADTFDDSPSHLIEDRYGKPEWQSLLRKTAGIHQDETLVGLAVLDLACGTGEISKVLCSLGASVTGLDFSEAMLARARAKLVGQDWTPMLCDAEDLRGIDTESVDFAVTRHLAWTLTNPDAAFREWFRVLKPGGRILVNDGNWSQAHSLGDRLKRLIAAWLKPPAQRDEAEVMADRSIRQNLPFRQGLTREILVSKFEDAGFVFVQELDPSPLYSRGMRAWSFADRLRQSAENRFSLVFVKPAETKDIFSDGNLRSQIPVVDEHSA